MNYGNSSIILFLYYFRVSTDFQKSLIQSVPRNVNIKRPAVPWHLLPIISNSSYAHNFSSFIGNTTDYLGDKLSWLWPRLANEQKKYQPSSYETARLENKKLLHQIQENNLQLNKSFSRKKVKKYKPKN